MKLTRRQALAAAGVTSVALAGCNRVSPFVRRMEQTQSGPPQVGDDPNVRLLNRFAFGPTYADMDSLRVHGSDRWIETQLHPDQSEPLDLQMLVSRLETEHLSSWELRDWKREAVLAQMRQKSILMATYSPWQLRERMVDFWSNHFSIFADKSLAAYRKPLDERTVIRKHALGSFPNMVRASAESTAMLIFLDQQASNASHPNENYGRELLELHTLGVHGGYTQKDVMEVARCFTGWTEERGFMKPKGKFKFDDSLHDKGEKLVLGHHIPAGGGIEDGQRVLDIVTRHPATARHISEKLVRYLLGSAQPDLESKVAEQYAKTDGDIAAMIRLIFEAAKGDVESKRIKRPFDFVISSLRAVNATTDGGGSVQSHLNKMGQGLYTWPMPDGYPMRDDAWTTSVLSRWQFATELTEGKLGDTSIDLPMLTKIMKTKDPVELATHLPAAALPRVAAIAAGLKPTEALALVLSSPEFQWI